MMARDDDDVERFTTLYRTYYSLILATCSRRLGDRSAAEDATQEVFRIAWQRFAQADPTLTWLYAIARNVVGNAYQRSAHGVTIESDVNPFTQRDYGDAIDVIAAMRQLRPADRELLYMAYWEDLVASEIAAILGISTPAVWVRLTRARESLKQRLLGVVPVQRSSRHG